MSYETLFYFINAAVPVGWAVDLQIDHWRYSCNGIADPPEKRIGLWLHPSDGGDGEWIHGTPEALLEAVRAKFPVPLKQAA